jgi:hypothetical protein
LGHELGVAPNRINVLNFSQSLASANYVTRTLLAQCRANRPHLVIANFSDMKRTEFFVDGAAQGVLPRRFPLHRRWKTLRHGWRQRLARMLPDLRDRRDAELRLGMWDRYAGLYSREWGVVNTLTNMLLLQSFCQSRNIDCLISWVQHDVLGEQAIRENPAIAPLIDLLDSRCFCSFSIVDSDICTDLAADDIHPGIASNRAFAARLVQTWAASYGRAPAEDDLEDTIARAMRR